MTYREVIVEDAITWLKRPKDTSHYSFVASLPDISEFPQFNLDQWKEWFVSTAELIFQNTSDDGIVLFFQSDIKWQGGWVDKGYLCQKAAEQHGCKLLWHKIICRSPAGTTTFGRPAYSHILCFSKKLTLETSESTPDVISEMGEKTWQRGMGLEACLMMAKFLSAKVPEHIIVNPFCGEGSMLAAVNAYGLSAIGIERSQKRAQKAKELTLNLDQKKWI
jgi:hypothetical protein